MVQELKTYEEFQELISSGKTVVIDFWAEWCGPCKQISPIFVRLAAEYSSITFAKVNVDDAAQISEEVGIRAMPTFMVFKNGVKIDELVGAMPPRLQELIVRASNA
ncbi:hypothetical protein QCA50_015317 [Cerrena zonata]|uniref:Thioredoxin n=1 Tax=Cerrena zonata TaxID=2478898 RepID=A0AAW0FPS5_9APHY